MHENVEPQQDIQSLVYDRVLKFIKDNDITCEDAIYQCDWVIENAYSFIGDLYNIIESELINIEIK